MLSAAASANAVSKATQSLVLKPTKRISRSAEPAVLAAAKRYALSTRIWAPRCSGNPKIPVEIAGTDTLHRPHSSAALNALSIAAFNKAASCFVALPVRRTWGPTAWITFLAPTISPAPVTATPPTGTIPCCATHWSLSCTTSAPPTLRTAPATPVPCCRCWLAAFTTPCVPCCTTSPCTTVIVRFARGDQLLNRDLFYKKNNNIYQKIEKLTKNIHVLPVVPVVQNALCF